LYPALTEPAAANTTAFLGQAAVAMWWNMATERREEFEHWHSHDHFPERMGIPGFQRGSRWSSRYK
jgi:hypothetical protein